MVSRGGSIKMGIRKTLLMVSLLVFLSLILTACGPGRMTAGKYQELVLATLEGQDGPGLVASIKILFDALYCPEASEEYPCVYPSELLYLAEMAENQRAIILINRSKICNKRVRPAKEMEEAHQKICDLLKEISLDIDAIKITANQAASALGSTDNPQDQEAIAKSHSRQILRRKEEILKALRELSRIEWLKPLFTDIKEKIPEFEASLPLY